MRKVVTQIALISTVSVSLFAQLPTARLSDPFAKIAIKALLGIEGESGTAEMRDGEILFPTKTKSLLDDADVEARTPAEKHVVTVLTEFWVAKVTNNTRRRQLTTKARADLQLDFSLSRDQIQSKAYERVRNDPTFIAMERKETACAAVLDKALRARLAVQPSVRT